MQEDITEKIQRFVDRLSSLINVQSPAQIRKVNEDGTVDILVFKNDEIENQVIPHVKIKHLESGSAFVYLGANVGDYGVVRYFDSNIQDYLDGQIEYNFDDRSHDTNDACFELGFIPNPSAYVFPAGKTIAIGNKDGSAILTMDASGKININSATVNITGGNVTIGGNTTIDGKSFLQHQHSNGNQGANTGGVVWCAIIKVWKTSKLQTIIDLL